MSATATEPTTNGDHPAATKAVKELLAKRDAIVKLAETEITKIEDAKAKNDAKARLSAGGRLANRIREIRELEADLAIEGHDIDAYEKPTTTRSRQTEMTQPELQANLDKVYETYQRLGDDRPTVKTTLSQRAAALKASADKRGYTVDTHGMVKK